MYMYDLEIIILGMLLRLFMYMYDLEIIEEESFTRWKEEVNDEYPGKGKALFQVWLYIIFISLSLAWSGEVFQNCLKQALFLSAHFLVKFIWNRLIMSSFSPIDALWEQSLLELGFCMWGLFIVNPSGQLKGGLKESRR